MIFLMPSPCPIPFVNVVLPAPKSPVNVIIEWGKIVSPIRLPKQSFQLHFLSLSFLVPLFFIIC